jgi:hypothetical protein
MIRGVSEMRPSCSVMVLSLSLFLAAIAQDHPAPKVSSESLTKEQVAVYRAVLQDFLGDSKDMLNLANTTEPLGQPAGPLGRGCPKTSSPQVPDAPVPIVHRLDPAVTLNLKVDLVDPERLKEKIKTGAPAILMKRVIDGRENVPEKEIDDATERAVRNGLFTLSEVVFNKEHSRALVSYDFVCGELCGHASVFLLKKVGEKWKVHKTCQEWFR